MREVFCGPQRWRVEPAPFPPDPIVHPVGRFRELTMHTCMTTVVACPVPWSTTVMQPRAARWTLGPGEVWILTRTHELLMGRRTFALAERLAASAYWPPDKLQGLQLGKLRRLVEHAHPH